jgi:hypothetical protein
VYLRHTTRVKDGKAHTYWRLVRSVRRGGKVVQSDQGDDGTLRTNLPPGGSYNRPPALPPIIVASPHAATSDQGSVGIRDREARIPFDSDSDSDPDPECQPKIVQGLCRL